MNAVGAHAFETSQQRWIKEVFEQPFAGPDDLEQAAAKYAKLITSTSQYDYGNRYVPKGTRSMAGRLGMMLGNFSLQTGRYVRYAYRASANHPTALGKAKWAAASLGTMGAIYVGLEQAQKATGWNFRGMHPLYSLVTSGGPVIEAAANTVLGAADVTGDIQGVINNRELPKNAKIDLMVPVRAVANFAQEVNPLAGLGYQAGMANEIMSAPNPFPVAAQAFFTGGSGLGNAVQGQMVQQIEAMGAHELNNMSPVPASPRTANPGVRLPGANQFSGPERGPARAGRGFMQTPDEMSRLMQQFVEKSRGTHGAGGGAF
jgi:hypothetical protein